VRYEETLKLFSWLFPRNLFFLTHRVIRAFLLAVMNHFMSSAWRVSRELTQFYRIQKMYTGSNRYYMKVKTRILLFFVLQTCVVQI
jgi:phosphotransferase system  glucose/maltose/N-acetylglucosamine-specific IIC component